MSYKDNDSKLHEAENKDVIWYCWGHPISVFFKKKQVFSLKIDLDEAEKKDVIWYCWGKIEKWTPPRIPNFVFVFNFTKLKFIMLIQYLGDLIWKEKHVFFQIKVKIGYPQQSQIPSLFSALQSLNSLCSYGIWGVSF